MEDNFIEYSDINVTKDILDYFKSEIKSLNQYRMIITLIGRINTTTLSLLGKNAGGDELDTYHKAFKFAYDNDLFNMKFDNKQMKQIMGNPNMRNNDLVKSLENYASKTIKTFNNDFCEIVPIFGKIRIYNDLSKFEIIPNEFIGDIFKTIDSRIGNKIDDEYYSSEYYFQVNTNDYLSLNSFKEITLYEYMCSNLGQSNNKKYVKNTIDLLEELGVSVNGTERVSVNTVMNSRFSDSVKKPLEKVNSKCSSIGMKIEKINRQDKCKIFIYKK